MSRPVVLISGGVKRVGRAIARRFAEAGWDLVLTFNTSGHEAEVATAELGQLGAAVRTDQLDLDDPDGVVEFARVISNECERVDALVHNALTRPRFGCIDASRSSSGAANIASLGLGMRGRSQRVVELARGAQVRLRVDVDIELRESGSGASTALAIESFSRPLNWSTSSLVRYFCGSDIECPW
jgi:NAD(P)-dependent dehydrogenase (short-subunit alcohol dehydrogenase family)